MSRQSLINKLETRNSGFGYNYHLTDRDILARMMQERKIDPGALQVVSQFLNPRELSSFGATSFRRAADVKNIQNQAKNKLLLCKKKMQNGKKCLKNIHSQYGKEDSNSEKSCQEWCRMHIKGNLEKELLAQLKLKCEEKNPYNRDNREHIIPLNELRDSHLRPQYSQTPLTIEGALVVITENCNPLEYQNYFISGIRIYIGLRPSSGGYYDISPDELENIQKLALALTKYLATENRNQNQTKYKSAGGGDQRVLEESKEIKENEPEPDQTQILIFQVLKMLREIENDSSYEVRVSKVNNYSPITIQVDFKPTQDLDPVWEFLYQLFHTFENNVERIWNERLEKDCLLRANVFMSRRENNLPIEIKIRLNDSSTHLSIILIPPRETRKLDESKRTSYARESRRQKAESWKYYLIIDNSSDDFLEFIEDFIDEYSAPFPTLTQLSLNSTDRKLLADLDLILNFDKNIRQSRSEMVAIDSLGKITIAISNHQEPPEFLCRLASTFPEDSLVFPDFLAETFKFLGNQDIYTIGTYHPIHVTDIGKNEKTKEYERYVSRLGSRKLSLSPPSRTRRNSESVIHQPLPGLNLDTWEL